ISLWAARTFALEPNVVRGAQFCSAADRLIRRGPTRRCRAANDQAVRVAELFENLQFLEPSHKGMCCSVRLFSALRVLHPVQDFMGWGESRASFLLAGKARRMVEVADDPPILEMQLRREMKLNRHAAETPGCAGGSRENQCDQAAPSRSAVVSVRASFGRSRQ